MSRILPILFNTDMVRAILDGRKTVTRRICKDGDDYTVPDMDFYNADKRTYAVHSYADKEHTWSKQLGIGERSLPICPGDILYVRESYHPNYFDIDTGWGNNHAYKADYEAVRGEIPEPKWTPSIHMPKEAARIWLKVTDVRVERLQDISIEDISKEGFSRGHGIDETWYERGRMDFLELWNLTVKEDWQKFSSNPWVWVYEFERCEKPD